MAREPTFHEPGTAGLGSRDRVQAKSPDGDDPEEDEEHEHDELRLLERRLGLRRRNQQVYVSLRSKVDQMAHFAKYASVTPDTPPSGQPTLWRTCRVLANRKRLRIGRHEHFKFDLLPNPC